MSLRGVTIKEGNIGLNAVGDEREFGLICNGVAIVGKLALNEAIVLRRPADARALGIDAAYDKANNIQVYRHISEFYRMAGEGRKLNIMLVAQTVVPALMVAPAKQLITAAGGMIADLAVAYNPPANYTETQTDGLSTDIRAAIQPLQQLAEWAFDKDMPLNVILEGRSVSDDLATLSDLRALEIAVNVPLEATKLSLVIGQDYSYADGLNDLGKNFADVGNVLGILAAQNWNQNIAEVQTQNLTNAALGVFTVGGLSNHKKWAEVFEELDTLNDKGYIFPIVYQGISGYRWNDAHVCAPIIVDAEGNMNQSTIYYSHTINECVRALRKAYLPEIKKVVELDPETGKLPDTMVDFYNSIGNEVFSVFADRKLISGGSAVADPDSDLLTEKVLKIKYTVVPTGCINEIVGYINLKTQL